MGYSCGQSWHDQVGCQLSNKLWEILRTYLGRIHFFQSNRQYNSQLRRLVGRLTDSISCFISVREEFKSVWWTVLSLYLFLDLDDSAIISEHAACAFHKTLQTSYSLVSMIFSTHNSDGSAAGLKIRKRNSVKLKDCLVPCSPVACNQYAPPQAKCP